jgi:hypothetical protein
MIAVRIFDVSDDCRSDIRRSIVFSKEIGLEVNVDRTKYMVMSGDQNAGRSHSIKIDNRSFEIFEEFSYLGTTVTNQNSIQEEIKSRLKWGMLVIIRRRIFCLPGCYSEIKRLRYTEIQFCLLFCVGVKLGFSH